MAMDRVPAKFALHVSEPVYNLTTETHLKPNYKTNRKSYSHPI